MAKKLLLAAAVVCGLLAVAIAVVFLVDFDSPELGGAVVERVNEATGAELTVGRYRLNLIRGLELEDVDVATSVPGGRLSAHLEAMELKHRLLPLLRGVIAVERIVLRHPAIEITGRSEGQREGRARVDRVRETSPAEPEPVAGEGEPVPTEGPAAGGRGLALEVAEILIEEGSIRVRRESGGEATTSVEGLNLRLRDLSFDPRAISIIHALSASGQLDIEVLALDSTEVRQVGGELELENGHFRGQDFAFQTDQGQFHAEVSVNFNQIPFGYTLALQGDPLDVNAIAGATDGGFGPGTLDFDAEGYGTDSRGIKGKGVLRLAEGKLPTSPSLAGVEKALGRGTSLVGAPYQATDAPFQIQNNQLTLEGFRLETPQAALDLKGTVDLEGPLALSLVLRTPREGLAINEVPPQVLDALTDDEGWVSVPLLITGTREEPRVVPDSSALMAQAKKSTGKIVEEEVKSFFQKMFE